MRVSTPVGEGVISSVVDGDRFRVTLDIGGSGVILEGEVGGGRSHQEYEYFGPRADEFREEYELEPFLESPR